MIQVRSIESRVKAPWIEVHSTEIFLLLVLNWGDAQTWLGQLVVLNIGLHKSIDNYAIFILTKNDPYFDNFATAFKKLEGTHRAQTSITEVNKF